MAVGASAYPPIQCEIEMEPAKSKVALQGIPPPMITGVGSH